MNTDVMTNDQISSEKAESLFTKFIIEKVSEFWKGKRLRDVLLYSLFLGIICWSVPAYCVPKHFFTMGSLSLGFILGIGHGIFMIMHFSTRTKNNCYYMGQVFSTKKILLAFCVILICRLIDAYVDKSYAFKYLYLPIGTCYMISVVISLLWLLNYERKNGIVYVVYS